jgi:cyclin B
LDEIFQNEINTSCYQSNENPKSKEEKAEIPKTNPLQLTGGNIQTTISSLYKNTEQDTHLDTSNARILQSPSIQMKQKYSFVKDYFDEVYQNLLLDELRFHQKINCNYMIFQKNINDKMRAILVDWIIDIHHKLNLMKKTLFHCIFIIDAFLSKNEIERQNFQLLGMVALLIACKQNETIYPPLISFLAFSDNLYTLKELTNMEKKVILTLEFDILAPTADDFFMINAEYFEFTEKQKFFGEYFLDASLIDYHLLKYKQSTIAVACGYIVIKFFNLNGIHLIVNNTLSDINSNDVKNCAKDLCFFLRNLSNSSLGSTKNKYMSDKYMNVAKLCENI